MAFSHGLVFAPVLIAFACLYSGARSQDVCVIYGKTYKAGESFIDEGCTAKCQCHSGGGISCVSLCPPSRVACKVGETIKYKKDPVASSDGRCFCSVPYCAKANVCDVDGVKYEAGQRFTNKACTGQCTCHSGGHISCVSLCPPHQILCPPGKKESSKKVPAGNDGRCFCDFPICV
ncbi:cysteine-rich motor neuron 1 protein-like [Actinia tenebrosa]|uniref:Cysteine-rich motor neuron 1 protein-like n=1 Tax=Actinia tenebrosa TaxID=6105 RepID=A0A6P8GZY7_ACTTE|nr:cysteine-rich motor neuron 1 protein-like [Actinia tenebrosa]